MIHDSTIRLYRLRSKVFKAVYAINVYGAVQMYYQLCREAIKLIRYAVSVKRKPYGPHGNGPCKSQGSIILWIGKDTISIYIASV